jgi:type IV pilus assembly protein PilN
MIRINLLGVERAKATKAFALLDPGRRITILSSLVLVVAALGIGFWYWWLGQQSSRLDAEIAAAQQESARLQTVLAEVAAFEARRDLVQQRVALIEQLRSGQSIPVQILDHVSRSLPDMMWLTAMQQNATTLTIQGLSTTLIGLSDFVGNLGTSPLLQRPVEIVNSEVTTGAGPELIEFTVRANINRPQPPAPAAGRGGAARGRGAARGGRGAAN